MMQKPLTIQFDAEWDAAWVSQIEGYLREKETHLSREVSSLIPAVEEAEASSVEEKEAHISQTVEAIAKKIRAMHTASFTPPSSEEWLGEIRSINQAFWEYVEVLEGAVTELFHQVHFVGIEKWQESFFTGVTAVKEILIRRIEDISWNVRRLENHLKEYRYLCETRNAKGYFWKKWLIWWQPVLDPALFINLGKSGKFCTGSYSEFARHFAGYQTLEKEVEEYKKKFTHFHVLSSCDSEDFLFFSSLCGAIRLWELNQRQKAFPQPFATQAIRQLATPDAAYQFFQRYDLALREAIFTRSRELKKGDSSGKSRENVKKSMQDELLLLRREVRTLTNTAAKYRDFLLRTDPDPYVRSRWGFTEWIVGPEPSGTRKFLHLAYETKELRELLDRFIKSLSEPSLSFSSFRKSELYRKIEYTLHEMAQPLNTEEMMQRRSETLLTDLMECKEISSVDQAFVDYVGDVLARAFRDDWKYHVLQDEALFQKVYAIHAGIVGVVDGEPHQRRKKAFTQEIRAILALIKKKETPLLQESLEGMIGGIKEGLEEFLATVQEEKKREKPAALRSQTKAQLLEYRVLFGHFLRAISAKTFEGQPMRGAFFFIDQYLESVERIFDDGLRETL